jgi:hypothetical protein
MSSVTYTYRHTIVTSLLRSLRRPVALDHNDRGMRSDKSKISAEAVDYLATCSPGRVRTAAHLRHNHHYLYRAEVSMISAVLPTMVESPIQDVSSARTEAEIDFVANNPGLTLFHCHQQLHMDFGFMTSLDEV